MNVGTTSGTRTAQRSIPVRRNTPLAKTWRVMRTWPVIPMFILGVLVFAGVLAPLLAPYGYREVPDLLVGRNAPPYLLDREWYDDHPRVQGRYWLGADHIGRDILSRVIHGARISLLVVGISLGSGLALGVTLGLLAGYYGRHIDEIVMRLVDVWLALPFILVALVVNVTIGRGFGIVMALLALLAWAAFVRNIRAEVLTIKEREYVAYARTAGASDLRIIVKHIVPQVINTAVVIATLQVGNLILAEAALSFLGAGIPDPTPAWGVMIAQGREHLNDAWWIALFPSLALFLVIMSLNFMGDWLRDRLDPRLRQVT